MIRHVDEFEEKSELPSWCLLAPRHAHVHALIRRQSRSIQAIGPHGEIRRAISPANGNSDFGGEGPARVEGEGAVDSPVGKRAVAHVHIERVLLILRSRVRRVEDELERVVYVVDAAHAFVDECQRVACPQVDPPAQVALAIELEALRGRGLGVDQNPIFRRFGKHVESAFPVPENRSEN